jgi:hypothetical protein
VIDLYRKFADGAFNKDSLEDELHKINAIHNAFDVKLKRVKVTKKVRHVMPQSPINNMSIKELQERYNKQHLLSSNHEVDHHVEVLEDELLSEKDLQHKRSIMFSAKELEQYANQFKGFIQTCFNARMRALQDTEDDEENDPFKRAIRNNINHQVAKVLDIEV